MNKFLFLFLTFFLIQTSVLRAETASEAIKSSIKNLNATQAVVDYSSNCAHCPKVISTGTPTSLLHSAANKTDVRLSLLSLDEAQKLFQELATNPDIPFGYPKDGCFARAHKMAQLMDKKGIVSGKAWVQGSIYIDLPNDSVVHWHYHVAPVVLIQSEKGPIPYVIDPVLATSPIPSADWKKSIQKGLDTTITDDYFTNRFAFQPSDRDKKIEQYRKSDIKLADDTNRDFLDLPKEDDQ